MDGSLEDNLNLDWVIVNHIDIAEEAVESNLIEPQAADIEKHKISGKSLDNENSDWDSISILSAEVSSEDEITNTCAHETEEKDEAQKDGDVKWMLVDKDTDNTPEASKQFYLDCLQEPFQELSENELGSFTSDAESDDFNIIRETKNGEENLVESNEVLVNNLVKTEFSLRKYLNGLLLGTALLAVSSIFLGIYLKSIEYLHEELSVYSDDLMGDLHESLSDNIPEIQEKYDVPTALAFCREKHRSDDIFMEVNVRKCLDKIERRAKKRRDILREKEKVRKMEEYLRVKEKYLVEKEKFLIKKEFEVAKSEINQNCERIGKGDRKNKPADSDNFSYKSDCSGQYVSTNFDRSKNMKPSKRLDEKEKSGETKSKDTFESGKNNPNSNKRNNNKNGTFKNKEKCADHKQSKSKYDKSKKYKERRTHIRSDRELDKSTWYFDWMKGRELIRYMNIYYS